MPVQLTQEMVDFVMRPDVVKVLATANEDGSPNVGPKASVRVWDHHSLIYAEFTGKHHYQNVRRDPRAAVACIDWQARQGYRFVGRAEIHEGDQVFQEFVSRMGFKSPPKAVVRLLVDGVYALSGPQVGERIL
jgi:predicted pyridoxine 5'-phosphate oxidase superfamily flavin-nucleotide-binding protein